jgi:hypothetical protein
MSKSVDIPKDDLIKVDILWSQKYAMPVFITKDGTMYMPSTGEYAGYYDELVRAEQPKKGKESDED